MLPDLLWRVVNDNLVIGFSKENIHLQVILRPRTVHQTLHIHISNLNIWSVPLINSGKLSRSVRNIISNLTMHHSINLYLQHIQACIKVVYTVCFPLCLHGCWCFVCICMIILISCLNRILCNQWLNDNSETLACNDYVVYQNVSGNPEIIWFGIQIATR